MNRFASHFKPLTWLMALLLLAAFVAGCADSTSPETSPPRVSSTVPASAATGVSLSGDIVVTFSEPMDPASINSVTFTLKQGTTVVPGAVSYVDTTATFNPTSALAASTAYTATLSTGAKDLAGNALAADRTWSFTTGLAPDTTAPGASSSVPASGATGVPIDANITAVFNEAMDPTTITTTTFTLMQGTTAVPGAVSYVGTTATFNPTNTLAASTLHTATLTTGVKDLANNALAAAHTWTFTTGLAPDTTAPSASSTNPGDGATGVALGGNIAAIFSEAMDAATITTTTFTLQQGITVVPGAVSYVGTTATFNPTSDLAATTLYTAAISTAAKDLAGNSLAAIKTWNFTTGIAPDITAPAVSATVPATAAIDVAVNANVTATFSEAMDPLTITTANFTLKQGATVVPGAVTSPNTTTATFNPTSDLANSTTYTATISTGAKDLAGNAMAADKTWSFTTGAAAAQGPAPVLLGTAGSYAIFAKTAITNSTACPTPCITGDVGIGPDAISAALTGFAQVLPLGSAFSTSPQVAGKVYAFDYAVPTPSDVGDAKRDMGLAYDDAAGRPVATALPFLNLQGGNLTTQTLLPGLYTWNSVVNLGINQILTLSGGANDVWIFQVGGALNTLGSSRVQLIGGAVPKNVFWQVNGAVAVAAAPAHFEGVVLSSGAITVGNQATITGRLLSQGAITLDRTTVTQPAP